MTRPEPPKRGRKRTTKMAGAPPAGVSREPSGNPELALTQLKRTIGVWPADESVRLIACENLASARMNSFADGRWVVRRTAEESLVALVENKDGSLARVSFKRGLLDRGWKHVATEHQQGEAGAQALPGGA